MRIAVANIVIDSLTVLIGGNRFNDYQINSLGRFLARRIAHRPRGLNPSAIVWVVWNALDGLMNGLDYLDYVETYSDYADALAGDNSERACLLLNDMLYRCSDAEDTTYLTDMMAESKHWQHYYREYC
jgi:hypothetical protein